ncbi:sulfatase family protein [Horticoccus sp. 23ND18S-11]|uniref:sulfatase family protein n=1 Tax=Horticoccus sp. 23ND18S-11 TaxID=3391832 RepID=UPI0039C92AFD
MKSRFPRLRLFPVLSLLVTVASAAAPAARPNILFILADDLGIGDVSSFNPKSKWQTPHLDRLAQEGMRFTDAHSSSGVCTPTRYTLLTGRHSWRSKLKRGVLQGYSPSLIESGRLTLPGFLRAQGYTTAMFGKWHLGLNWAKRGTNAEDVDFSQPIGGGPIAHGFDRFYGISASLDMPPYVWIQNDRVTALPAGRVGDSPAPKLWRAGPIGADFKMEEVQPRLTEKTIAYLAERGAARDGKPFFLYLALASPHTPTLPTATFAGKTPSQYGDFVLQIDADVGAILAALEKHGLARDTLVIFTSDNGYAPAGDIPPARGYGHDSSAGFRGTKSDAFEGGHRIPFIARWPGVTPPGSRSADLIGHLDVFATVAEILGATLPDDAAEDSSSLLALLRGQPSPATRRDSLVHHSAEGEFAIRQGEWKLILCPGSGGWSPPTRSPSPWTQPTVDDFTGLPPFQLYNLATDPAEQTNLAAKHPEIVQRLGRLMRTTIERGRSTPGAPQKNAEGPWPQIAWREQFAP